MNLLMERLKALHAVNSNDKIASVGLPVFVVTAGVLLEGPNNSVDDRRVYVAETFGVDVGNVVVVCDIAKQIGAKNDRYNYNGSWPLCGYRIEIDTPWWYLVFSTNKKNNNNNRSSEMNRQNKREKSISRQELQVVIYS
eukprot:GHVS01004040.1.p1 GENE.GHVS01004040.1~~GHVS01004040.1.p1  ORF type:complete len:139 (+),score=17.84 GHVS01004040.1:276-692(+)